MAKKPKRYTEEQRARILSAAAKAGLTGRQAAKKFGVSEVTLWKWRRDAKGAGQRRPKAAHTGRASANGSLAAIIRAEVQARVREMIPTVVRDEVARAFRSKPERR